MINQFSVLGELFLNESATNREELGHSVEEDKKSKAEERTDLSLFDWGSPCLLGGGVRGEGSHHKNGQTDRGEGCERKCAERRDEKSGAKTHGREHINNNNTNNNTTTTQKIWHMTKI